MSGLSEIAHIVDYTAAVAGLISGVTATRGVASGLVNDPLNPGHTIMAAGTSPSGSYEHWSDLPDATEVSIETQDGGLYYTWDIPMRLWLPRADLAETRRTAIPFVSAYPNAFMNDPRLGGLATVMPRMRFAIGSDDKWSWLHINLEVLEVLL